MKEAQTKTKQNNIPKKNKCFKLDSTGKEPLLAHDSSGCRHIASAIIQPSLAKLCNDIKPLPVVLVARRYDGSFTRSIQNLIESGEKVTHPREDRRCRQESVYKAEQKVRRTLLWICSGAKLPSGATWPAHPAKASGAQAYLSTHKQLRWRRHCGRAAGAASERDSSHSPCNSKITHIPASSCKPAMPCFTHSQSGEKNWAFRRSDWNGQLISAAWIIDFENRVKITSFNPKIATDTWLLCSMEQCEQRAIINKVFLGPGFGILSHSMAL